MGYVVHRSPALPLSGKPLSAPLGARTDRSGTRRDGARQIKIALAAIVVAAVVLRLVGLATVPLWGDEYNSIDHATAGLGVELTSLLYSLILRGVLTFGHSVYIMRLPSAIFGALAVFPLYGLGAVLVNRRTGLAAALLGATSAFAIFYSQEVRFYSLYLCTGTLALYALAVLLRDGATPGRVALLCVANLLCLAAHPLGMLLVIAEAVSLAILTATPRQALRRVLMLCVLAVAGGALLSIRPIREWGFHLLIRYTGSESAAYAGPRGVHVANGAVKTVWTYFVLAFGERVYPLWLWITLPGAIVVAVLLAFGLWSQRRNRLALGVLLPPLLLGPLLLYFVLDAVASQALPGAAPRYLTPLLAPFLVLIAAGAMSWPSRRIATVCLALAVGVNALSLNAYWRDTWDYNGYSPPWTDVAALVARHATPGAIVLVDGRSVGPAQYYLRDLEQQHRLVQENLDAYALATIGAARRLVVIANTDRPDNQRDINRVLAVLQRRYVVTDGLVRYPLFAYVLDLRSGHLADGGTARVRSGWTPVAVPLSIYGLNLADLALPATIHVAGGSTVRSLGALSLGPDGAPQTFALPAMSNGREVLLATTLDGDTAVADGMPVASLTLAGPMTRQTVVLRKGRQIDDWQRVGERGDRPGAQYTVGLTWIKLVSLVGQRAYPEAYRQFVAGIGVTIVHLSGRPVMDLTLRYLAGAGVLHVWAVALR